MWRFLGFVLTWKYSMKFVYFIYYLIVHKLQHKWDAESRNNGILSSNNLYWIFSDCQKVKRLKPRIALNGKPMTELYGASLAIWDHTELPAPRHKWMRPAVTPANQAGTRFTYPGGMEGWVDLGSLIAARPGIKPTTAWSQVRRPNHYATESLSYASCWKITAHRCMHWRGMHIAVTTPRAPVQSGYLCMRSHTDWESAASEKVFTNLIFCNVWPYKNTSFKKS